MRTDLLRNEFEVSDRPGLEIFDPRLEEITTLVQNGALGEAASPLESVFEDGILDIRIVGYYSYMVFDELGLSALADLFADLAGTFDARWDAVGPLNNREKIAQNGINWFLKMLLKRLQREEEIQGPLWNLWIGTLTSDEVSEILERASEFQRALGVLGEHAGTVLDHLSKVSEWLRAFEKAVYQEPEPEHEEGAVPEEEHEEETAHARPERRELSTEGSFHLGLLIRKMEAFERLLEAEQYPRAALVAEDVQNIIANFDPTLYFPELFRNFTKLLAVHMVELAEFEDAKETRDWQAMHAFYQVDLDGFVDLEG